MKSLLDIWIYRKSFKPKFNAEEILPKVLSNYDEFKGVNDDIRILRDLKGKPRLQTGSKNHDLQFSLSHSGEYLVVALIAGRSIGIDVEKIRDNLEFEALVGEFFTDEESSTFRKLTHSGLEKKSREYFYRVWTTKEAISKVYGEGLSTDLRQVNPSLWEVRSIEFDPDYRMTLALERGMPFEIRIFYG